MACHSFPILSIIASATLSITGPFTASSRFFLRLCYWINKCRQIITDKRSFENKLIEIKQALSFQNLKEVKEHLKRRLLGFKKIMKDTDRHLYGLVTELERKFRSNVSSIVPELMLAALLHEAGFRVRFISTMKVKTCDLLVESYKTEVKTFLDLYKEGTKVESDLINELKGTRKRDKAVNDINDSLEKKSEIIFLCLTVSSLGVGFAKYTFDSHHTFSLSSAAKVAISLAEQNRCKPAIDHVPVVVFTTMMDAINRDYKIFFHTISYPVKTRNNNIKADPDSLDFDISSIFWNNNSRVESIAPRAKSAAIN
jgi:hypothetical protein